jgi:hypothetical protein
LISESACGYVAGSLITGDDSSHGSEDAHKESVSQHFPAAVASSEESYARKFGHYGSDSRCRCEQSAIFNLQISYLMVLGEAL